jgi:hypothetical protein
LAGSIKKVLPVAFLISPDRLIAVGGLIGLLVMIGFILLSVKSG